MIIYDIGDNRWCGNIQREHKSNHIYYVADLTFSHLYQKCHDFECNAYRSEEIPIPQEINPIHSENGGNISDDDLMAMFDSDIDFVGKKENFFSEGDTFLDEEILKLSTTSVFGNSFQNLSPSNPLDNAISSNSSVNSICNTFNVVSERPTACESSTYTTLVNDTIDEDISMCSSDDDIFLDKSLSFTEDNANQVSETSTMSNALLNSSADLFGGSQEAWSNSLFSKGEPTMNSTNVSQTPQENSNQSGSTLSFDSKLPSTSEIKPNKNWKVLDSKDVMFSSSQENTLNKFFEEDFSFD